MKNTFKTVILLTILTLLLLWIGEMIGGRIGLIYALIMAGVMNFLSYWFSDKIVMFMTGAKKTTESQLPNVYKIVRELSTATKIPMPQIYLINTELPNAFATGRGPSRAAIAVTNGILNILNEKELKGVIAHEISHIINRDVLIATISATIAGAIMFLARMASWAAIFGTGSRDRQRGGGLGYLIIAILAPISALLIQMAISRTREYQADRSAGRITTDPLSLASSLRKLEEASKRRFSWQPSPAVSHLFIVNPLRGESILTLFSTHPPISQRVKRLEELQIELSKQTFNIPKIIR